MELISALGKVIPAKQAKELLAKHRQKPVVLQGTVKLAIIIGNSKYQIPGWDDLPGAKKDADDMEARLRAEGYRVELIENSPDFLTAGQELMNKLPVSSVTHLQVLYVGHGEHKTKTLVGRKLEENDEVQVSAQQDILGDVLVSVTGLQFTEDELIWEILEGDPRE